MKKTLASLTAVLLTVLMVAPAVWAGGVGEVREQTQVIPQGENPRVDVSRVNRETMKQLAPLAFVMNNPSQVPLPVIPEPSTPIPVIPEATQPLPANDNEPVFREADPLGIIGGEATVKGKKGKAQSPTSRGRRLPDGFQLAMAGPVIPPPVSGGPPKPPPTYEGDAAKEAIKNQVMQQLYQAYLNYYNGSYGSSIMKKLKEMYDKYKTEMEKYYKALHTCPGCSLAVHGGTVYYDNGTGTQTTTPLALFADFMRIYHPKEYQQMVDQGILPRPAR